MSKEWLPEGYSVKDSNSGYMRFEEGDNRFRILDTPLIGYELWVDKKPHRFKLDEPIPQELADKAASEVEDGQSFVKEFWAFPVWNYQDEKVQILEIAKRTILKPMQNIIRNPKWGNPEDYDFVVTRTGKGKGTKYDIQPEPKEVIDAGIVQMYKDMGIKLDALWKGDNPFGTMKNGEKEDDVKEEDIPF